MYKRIGFITGLGLVYIVRSIINKIADDMRPDAIDSYYLDYERGDDIE